MLEVIFKRCSGLDVHKETITACIMIGDGERVTKEEIRTYSTMTEDIEKLRDWLKTEGVTHVAMESTGIYWRPVFNILEEDFEILLANARHIKNVPGRKTDVQDSEWICKLLRNGLIRGSFIPPKHIRQLRDFTRYRRKIHDNIASEKNRLQKYLEDANIKLSSVATDILGASGGKMLGELLDGTSDAEALSKLAVGKLRKKEEALRKSFNGRITEHHRKLVRMSLNHIEYMERSLGEIEEEIERLVGEHQLRGAVELLDSIPGVDEEAAEAILAETGVDMGVFPSAAHIASWAGVAPGNNESAGKKKEGRPPMGTSG
ncbi:MAG: IS110 family transposase [Nitrospirota bacterium]